MSFPWLIDRHSLQPDHDPFPFSVDFRGSGVQPGNAVPDTRFDWSRGSEAWQHDANGNIVRAPHNFIGHSEDFGSWTAIRSPEIVANDLNSGRTNADKVIADGQTFCGIFKTNPHSLAGRNEFTVEAKADTGSFLQVQIFGYGLPGDQVWFNLVEGTVSQIETGLTASIEEAGQGFYKCSVQYDLSADLFGNIYAYVVNGSGISTTTDGDAIWLHKAQLKGLPAVDDYVQTTGSSIVYGAVVERDESGRSLGLRIEGQAQNIITDSDDISAWSLTRAVAQASSVTSPDGLNAAFELRDDNSDPGGAQNTVVATSNMTLTATTQYTLSALVHAHTGDQWVSIDTNAFGIDNIAYYHLSGAGAVGATQGADLDAARIRRLMIDGEQWYLIENVFTTAADTTGVARLRLADADGSVAVDLDGTSVALFWSVQCEEGAFRTSRIHTSGGTSTRSADELELSLAQFGYSSGDAVSVAVGAILPIGHVGTSASIATVYASDDANVVIQVEDSGSDVVVETSAGVFPASENLITTWVKDGASENKVGFSLDTNDLHGIGNDGSTVVVADDSSVAIPSAMTEVHVGRFNASNHLNGIITFLKVSPGQIEDNDLETIVRAA